MIHDGYYIVLTYNIINIKLRAAQFMKFCRMFLSLFGKPHMGNPLYLIVPTYTLEYQDPGPEILRE